MNFANFCFGSIRLRILALLSVQFGSVYPRFKMINHQTVDSISLDGSYAVPFCRRTIMPSFLRGPVRETRKDYVCPIQAS